MYVVNKSDRQGANRLCSNLKNMLDTNPSSDKDLWKTPVLKTNSLIGDGINSLIESIRTHFDYLNDSGLLANKINDRYYIIPIPK